MLKSEFDKAKHFCLQFVRGALVLSAFDVIDFNEKIPGVILRCNNKAFSGYYYQYVYHRFKELNVLEYFDIKSYNNSVHVIVKKQYAKQIDRLELLFELKEIY